MKRIGAVLYDGTSTLAELWPGGRWTVSREGRPTKCRQVAEPVLPE